MIDKFHDKNAFIKFLQEDITFQDINKFKFKIAFLNESLMDKFLVYIINGLMKDITKKCKKLDFDVIDKSKGKVYKVLNPNVINAAALDCKEMTLIRSVVASMQKNENYFKLAYNKKNEVIQTIYRGLLISIIKITSYIVSRRILDKMPTAKDKSYPINYVKFLDLYVKEDEKKNVAKFFKTATDSKYYITEEFLVPAISSLILAYGTFWVIKSFISIIRTLIYQYYHSKVNLAYELKSQADFLEINSRNIEMNNYEAAMNQRNRAASLKKMADSIEADLEESNYKGTKDLRDNPIEVDKNGTIQNQIFDDDTKDHASSFKLSLDGLDGQKGQQDLSQKFGNSDPNAYGATLDI